jgi:hypothetical protein
MIWSSDPIAAHRASITQDDCFSAAPEWRELFAFEIVLLKA